MVQMKSKLSLISIAVFALLTSACGDLTGEYTGADAFDGGSGKKQISIGGLNAVKSSANRFVLEGTADSGGNSGHSYRIELKLPEGSSHTHYFFCSRKLTGGVSLRLTRTAGKVELRLALNGKSHTIELSAFAGKETIDLDVDVHNDHTDTHILVWQHGGPYGDQEGCSDDGSCLYNTEDYGFSKWAGVGRASGVYWGFKGDSSFVQKLEGPLAAKSDA
jgi:hypothetical protein